MLFGAVICAMNFLLFGAGAALAEQQPTIEVGISEYSQMYESLYVKIDIKKREATTDHA